MAIPGYYGDDRDKGEHYVIKKGTEVTVEAPPFNWAEVEEKIMKHAENYRFPSGMGETRRFIRSEIEQAGIRRIMRMRLPYETKFSFNNIDNPIETFKDIDIPVISIERGGKLIWTYAASIY